MSKPVVLAFISRFLVVLAAIAGLVVLRELELVDPVWVKRLGGMLLGAVLVATGDLLPKFIGPVAGREPGAGARERWAGRIAVLAGLVVFALFLVAPLNWAARVSAVVVLVAVPATSTTIIAKALRAFAPIESATTQQLRAQAVRLALLYILISLVAAFGMILMDEIWGDYAAKWAAIAFTLILPVITCAGIVIARVAPR